MSRFDVLVVGGGPAGSVAALVLARGGVNVALVDKSPFPRDKACGDVVGPRGLQLLSDLGLAPPIGPDVGDMLVVGPTGRRVRLPSADGLTYPGHGTAVTRTVFDAMLHAAAVTAGVTPIVGRAEEPLEEEGRIVGYRLSTGATIDADFVIGADGATSEVAAAAGLVDPQLGSVGFCRAHLPATGGRSPGHRLVGADALAGVPRIRLDFSRRAGRRQRRSRHRDPVGSQGRRTGSSGLARFPRAPARPWTPRARSGGSVTPSRWLAQDGNGRDHAGEGARPSGRRCGRSREPDARGGDRPGHDQWSCGRGGDPHSPEPRSRQLSIQTRRRASPVPSDRRRGPRRPGGTAPGNGSGRSASDRGGPWRCAVWRLGGVLERAARRRTTQPASCGCAAR